MANTRKGLRWAMFGTVVLAALLGIAPGCEAFRAGWDKAMDWVDGTNHSSSESDVLARCGVDSGRTWSKAADPAKGKEILESIAHAAEIFSVRVGGGGDSLFPTNAFQMSENMPPVVARGIEGCFSTSAVPVGGYIFQYTVDSSRLDFLCKATPANGYTGGVYVIRKDMKVERIGEIINHPVIKAADPVKGRELLESVARAADVFSVRVGGGGDSMFPTNALQMSANMPPLVARSIEGCFSAPAIPVGGYVCQYVADPARTNFLCRAIPANGYTGVVFVIRKDMKVGCADAGASGSANSAAHN